MRRVLRSLLGEKNYKISKAKFARFAGAVGFNSMRYPARDQIDRRLIELFNGKRQGKFCEAGANDGYSESNTYALETLFGWSGILIEPVPFLFEACEAIRPNSSVINAALGGRGSDGTEVEMYFADLGSTLVHDHKIDGLTSFEHIEKMRDFLPHGYSTGFVPVRTLSSILAAQEMIDFDLLSLDVEGSELAALDGLNFEEFRPQYILAETFDLKAVQDILRSRYALIEQYSPHDYLFKRTS